MPLSQTMFKFNNTYAALPNHFYQKVAPAKFKNPTLLMFNSELAQELGMDSSTFAQNELAQIFSGQEVLDGSEPMALVYAAHQFGHFVPQLGDGRAHLLGEVNGFDIQLKGSGQTKFSRSGDGRSALGPVIREYIVSEAMHALGVPTSRALAAVSTGEEVFRNTPEPGGVFTRVAASHIRVGTFQYFFAREDETSLKLLLDYSIKRHYPELLKIGDTSEKAIAFLQEVTKRQATLVAKWLSLGFIHGVMNTDNFSIAGITIDYGPCAFMDEYNKNKLFSSVDRNGRYAYSNQIASAQWNIMRLADSLLYLIDDDQRVAVEKVNKGLSDIMSLFTKERDFAFAKKLGLGELQDGDAELVNAFLGYLEREEVDFTLGFRNLPALYEGDYSFYIKTPELEEFAKKWRARGPAIEQLDSVNPLYIPRNHQVERAIQEAYTGNTNTFKEIVEVTKNPFKLNKELDQYQTPPRSEERVHRTFCGT